MRHNPRTVSGATNFFPSSLCLDQAEVEEYMFQSLMGAPVSKQSDVMLSFFSYLHGQAVPKRCIFASLFLVFPYSSRLFSPSFSYFAHFSYIDASQLFAQRPRYISNHQCMLNLMILFYFPKRDSAKEDKRKNGKRVKVTSDHFPFFLAPIRWCVVLHFIYHQIDKREELYPVHN